DRGGYPRRGSGAPGRSTLVDEPAFDAEQARATGITGAEAVRRIAENLALVVRAPEETLRLVVLCLVAEGHLIIEDFPGVGKTMLAKALARSVDCSFSRIQFTPDLLPSDVTGVNVFNQKTNRFEFRSEEHTSELQSRGQ